MKFRIDKIPKTEEDMEEIVKEVEEEHGHEHHHHHEHEHDILDEILVSLQSLEGKVNQLSDDAEYCRREIKRIYLSMSKLLKAVFAKDDESRLQALTELKEVLEKEMTA
ncbi:MAG: hypothetical protein RXN77_03990 [Sulfolobaceae archaeon]|jgi:hypothetical protein|nr:hypothetical protein [Sulfolobales archaeon]MCQ4385166.1 hypothetical protein [Sulfolobales archaeon]